MRGIIKNEIQSKTTIMRIFIFTYFLLAYSQGFTQSNIGIAFQYGDPPYSNAEKLTNEQGILCQIEYEDFESLKDRIDFSILTINDLTRSGTVYALKAVYGHKGADPVKSHRACLIDDDELDVLVESAKIIKSLSEGLSPVYSEFHFITRGGFEISGTYTGAIGFTDVSVESTKTLSGFPLVGADLEALISILEKAQQRIQEKKAAKS